MKDDQKIITVIDDNPDMTKLLTTLLEMEKFKVIPLIITTKTNITTSIQNHKPDVIVMDIHLSDSNGIEILRNIKKDPNLKEIKVILTSGENLEREAMAAEADFFLLKPYMPNKLLNILAKLTNEKEGV